VNYYPVFLNLEGKRCIVIGGGEVAERKTLGLLNYGAKVRIISPNLTHDLAKLKSQGLIEHLERTYREGDLKGAFLIFAATSNMDVNQRIFEESQDMLVNVVDVPDLCSFVVPSIAQRGALQIAVSTSGVSPALSKTIREELEGLYHEDTGEFLAFLSQVRKKLKESTLPREKKTLILKKIGGIDTLKILRKSGISEAQRYIRNLLVEEGIG
jgi:precorrin-2 dehydrogenase/sirohydrochlorin ferrochelatase